MRLVWQIKKIDGKKALYPFAPESEKALEKFLQNQPVTSGSITGTRKERSLKQNNLYFKACAVFKEMIMPDSRFYHADVDMWFRYALKFFDYKKAIVLPDGTVHFPVLPLNFANCDSDDAQKYYDSAFELMSDMLMMDKESFIEMVKERCGG